MLDFIKGRLLKINIVLAKKILKYFFHAMLSILHAHKINEKIMSQIILKISRNSKLKNL